MSKTTKKAVEFTGELRWVVVPPFSQPQKALEPKPGQENNTHYTVEVECSEQQYRDLIKNGVSRMTVLREDEKTGKTFIRIRAPKVNGTYIAADPVVTKADGSEVGVMIANGSTGTVKANIETFSSKSGKSVSALRFHSIVIDKLVPFVRNENPNHAAEAYAQDQFAQDQFDDDQFADDSTTSNEDW